MSGSRTITHAVVAATLSLIIAALSGCGSTRPGVPSGWQSARGPAAWQMPRAAAADDLAADVAHRAAPAHDGPTGKVQLIICYGPVLNSHAAMRFEIDDDTAVYWDPGGAFGEGDPDFFRFNDLIRRPAPTIEQIWVYRLTECDNESMGVFEFELPRKRVRQLAARLITGAYNPEAPGAYNPDALGSQCAIAISDFVQKHMADRIHLAKRWFYPHMLGKQMWTQAPSRVKVFTADGAIATYLPPGRGVDPPDADSRPASSESPDGATEMVIPRGAQAVRVDE